VDGESWLSRWDEVVSSGDNSAIEELWLNRLEHHLDSADDFVEALRRLRSAGKKTVAASLLELAEVEASAQGNTAVRKAFLRELLRLGIGDAVEQRAELEACVRELWADRPSLAAFLAHFSLRAARRPVETLDALETWLTYDVGTVVSMAGRGPGRVVEASPSLGVLRIDFARDKRVPVPVDAAAKHLVPLPPGHFLRRRLEEPHEIERLVREEPPTALEEILESSGAEMTVTELKSALDGLVGADGWSSWWNRARKLPRLLAAGSGSRVRYRLAEGSGGEAIDGEIRREFERAGVSGKLELARRHGGRSRSLGQELAGGLLAVAADERVGGGEAWEALALAERLGTEPGRIATARSGLVARFSPLGLLAAVVDGQQRESLFDFLRTHLADGWIDTFAAWLDREEHPRLLSRLASALVAAGAQDRLDAFLDEVYLLPQRQPAAFVWTCEEAGDAAVAGVLDVRHTGALLVRLVELAERDELAPFRSRLKEVVSPRGLAGTVLQERMTVEQARRLQQILERPGSMAEERAWLRSALVTRFAELREVAGTTLIPALGTTLDRLKRELKSLLEKEIPETLRAIQTAREQGDLRENFEYHAARARQEVLSARAAELQGDIARIKVIDPTLLDLSVVRPGARVRLRPEGTGEARAVAILGPYEADPEHGVLSNESEAAQGLLDRRPGETVRFDGGTWTIDRIEPI
jgi:transcription elongation factor GreA